MYKLMGFCIAKSVGIPPPNLVIRNVEISNNFKLIIDGHAFATMPNYRRKITSFEDYFYRSNLKMNFENGMSFKTDFKLKRNILHVLKGEKMHQRGKKAKLYKEMSKLINATIKENNETLLIAVTEYNDNVFNGNYEDIERIAHIKNLTVCLHKTMFDNMKVKYGYRFLRTFGIIFIIGLLQWISITCFVFVFVFYLQTHCS